MEDIQELINLAEKICKNLDKMANEEIKFGYEICSALDRMSYDSVILLNQMKGIQNFIGGYYA